MVIIYSSFYSSPFSVITEVLERNTKIFKFCKISRTESEWNQVFTGEKYVKLFIDLNIKFFSIC